MTDAAAYAELVERARSGDAEAFEQLLVPHLAGLTAFVRLRGGDALRRRESSSDLVQSVCGRAMTGVAGFRGTSPQAVKQWLYATALNEILTRFEHHRAGRRDIRREGATGLDTAVEEGAVAACYASLGTPSRRAMAREEMERIESAFEQLPDDFREVLGLARVAGLSHAEIADSLGRSEVAVRKLLSRARARLAMLLA